MPDEAPAQAPVPTPPHDRFSLSPALRITMTTAGAFAAGGLLGLLQGGQTSGLRFRAENAHRLPSTKTGWFLYHKTKNVYVLRSSVREAFSMGSRCAPWVGLFFAVEEGIDELRARGDTHDGKWLNRDFLSTTVAGLSVAGGFSIWNQLDLVSTAKLAKTGLLAGLGFGLVQDGLHLLQGQHLAYVDLVKGVFRKEKLIPQTRNYIP